MLSRDAALLLFGTPENNSEDRERKMITAQKQALVFLAFLEKLRSGEIFKNEATQNDWHKERTRSAFRVIQNMLFVFLKGMPKKRDEFCSQKFWQDRCKRMKLVYEEVIERGKATPATRKIFEALERNPKAFGNPFKLA
ncbi:MAG: hypothetical protein V1936_04985 [Patescibacteria group bacterium]